MKTAPDLMKKMEAKQARNAAEINAYKAKSVRKARRFVSRLTDRMYRRGLNKATFKNRIFGRRLQYSVYFTDEVQRLLREAGYTVHEFEDKTGYTYLVKMNPTVL